jgi:steroid delta-isomerase-like uncharacterized protein
MADEAKETLQRIFDEVFSQGNIDAIDDLVAEDLIEHEEPPPGIPPGREGFKQFVQMIREAFPDLRFEVEEMIGEGDKAAAVATVTGTHQGEYLGIPPTNKQVKIEAIDLIRVEGGKCVEHWGVSDIMSLMQQLGAMPAQAPA